MIIQIIGKLVLAISDAECYKKVVKISINNRRITFNISIDCAKLNHIENLNKNTAN